jgi:manganese/iron transport system permease protein
MMILAAVIGAFSVWLGLTISYHFATAASATMALVPIILFFVVLGIRNVVVSRRKPVAV